MSETFKISELVPTSNAVTLYEAGCTVWQQEKGGYTLSSPMMNGGKVFLQRSSKSGGRDLADKDFGVIAGTRKPSLLKSGAEKIANACGMLQHYSIESKHEDFEHGVFFYVVKCELCKISNDGKEYVFYTGYGSANTLEKQVGNQSGYQAANARLKMAQKRALVSAVISMGGLSDLFTQDMENEDYIRGYEEVKATLDPNAYINAAQGKRLFIVAQENGYTAAEAIKALKEAGFPDAKKITNKQYEDALKVFERKGE